MSSEPLIIGHRGASAWAPENTLAAFRLALDVSADGIEFDVRLSKDGIPVVIHDDDLRRTGARADRVSDLQLAELRKVDIGSWFGGDARFSAETIPTLDQVVELFEPTSALLYLEMKSSATHLKELVTACCAAILRSKLKERVIMECFELAGLEEVKAIDASIKTAALFEPRSSLLVSARSLLSQALAVGADEIALHHRLANKRTVQAAIDAGLKVVVWTVDQAGWLRRAKERHVTAIITNDPAKMVRLRSEV